MPIKVAVADDHKIFREGLINLLSESPEIEVVAQAGNGEEAIEVSRKYRPDILIMDIGMPKISGIQATAQLSKELPDVKVIAISMHSDRHFIKGMLEAGAQSYMLKSCNYEQMLEAIRSVHAGKKFLDEEVTKVLIQNYINKNEVSKDEKSLSDRELEILKLVAEGKSSQEIADQLFISVKTVGTHKQNILDKLELSTTADLVKYAIKNGIIPL